MKLFKKADVIIQVILIAAALITNLIRQSDMLGEFFLFSYVIVGGWQLISVIIHFFLPAAGKVNVRKIYLVLAGVTLFTGLIIGITGSDQILGFFFVLLFWTPVLAILYLITCITENNKLNKVNTDPQ